MKSSVKISLNTWFLTSLIFGAGYTVIFLYGENYTKAYFGIVAAAVAAVASLPALILLLLFLPLIKRNNKSVANKWWMHLGLLLLICWLYGFGGSILVNFFLSHFNWEEIAKIGGICTAVLFGCAAIATAIIHRKISLWFMDGKILTATETQSQPYQSFSNQQISLNMNTEQPYENEPVRQFTESQPANSYNKTLIKAAITAGLILAMLIPANLITNLVQEKEQRQQEVVNEVSSKWARPQTFSTPYLCIPYKQITVNDTGKQVITRTMIFETASTLNVKADIQPEMRRRSIYNVLLYKSNINLSGNIILKLAKDIVPENLLINEARLCVGVSDFKGIEEKVIVNFNDTAYELEPGLPDNSIDKQGLSAPVSITQDIFTKELAFAMNIKLKGSEQLHFLPLSDNSNFEVSSPWRNPSFDGSSLPKERVVNDSGFTAKWSFNKANMPVLAQLFNTDANRESMAFGVTMVQPADQYAKTNRSVKYAILFIGLTFAMFFIIELMQKKNVHPVQYVLVGLALIIFYTLLLSISEFTGFNIAYAIAAAATVLLIGIYSKSLFASFKTSLLLSTFIGMLYGFIYVLIQLEDTALLAGSIGLFVLLAVAMYFSKRINWYAATNTQNILTT